MDVSWIMLSFKPMLLLLTLLDLNVLFTSAKKLKDANLENCEVCVTFMTKFIASLDDKQKGDPAGIEKAFKKSCKGARKDDNRFCYYVGGTEDSATSTISDITKPVSWGVPAEKVCMKLYRKDQQICDLKYEKQIDLTNINLKKLKVKDLKKILGDWEEQCKGCTEKNDYIKRIEELMPKHAPEAHAKRQKAEL